jgi:formamidopyrimidine-DNA glycosylase
MPELPEVETGRRIADRALKGRVIETVAVTDDRIVFAGVTPKRFAAALRGRKVIATHRRGKYIWFELDQRPWPLFHYGMSGRFDVYSDAKDRPSYWKVELVAADGTRLSMRNPRRLGRIRLLDDVENQPPISKLGDDPYLNLPSAAALAATMARRRGPIKALLLDQSFLAGVGNWIADEVLYQARIDPRIAACELSIEQVRRMRTKLRAILKRAVDVDADKNRFPRTWLFHYRWGKNADAVMPSGERIEHIALGGRTTAWVPTVQR